MNSKNEVFEYLIDQLRQQVNNNQCEDLAHEVQSLKSELARYKKPYIAYVKKTDWVQGDSRFLKKWGKHRADILRECIQEQDAELQSLKNQLRDASAQIKGLQETIKLMNEDFDRVTNRGGPLPKGKSYVVSEHGPEQSGCRKEDTQGQGIGVVGCVREGGVKVTGAKGECPHLWHYYDDHLVHCALCGLKRSDEDTKECEHDWQVKTYPWSDETYEYCPLCREVRQ